MMTFEDLVALKGRLYGDIVFWEEAAQLADDMEDDELAFALDKAWDALNDAYLLVEERIEAVADAVDVD